MSIVCYVVYGGHEIDSLGWQRVQQELAKRTFAVELVLSIPRSLELVARRERFGRLLANLETRESNGALELSEWPEPTAAELATRPHSIFLQAIGDDDAVLELLNTCACVLADQLDGLIYDESSSTLTRADGSDAKIARVVLPSEGIQMSSVGIGTALLEWPHDVAPETVERTVREVSPSMRVLRIGKVDHLDLKFAGERTRPGWRYVDVGDPDGTKLALELERRQRRVEVRIVVDDEDGSTPREPAIELARAVLDRLATVHGARLVGFEPD